MIKTPWSALCLFFLFSQTVALARTPYLNVADVDFLHLLPGPPALQSSEDENDFRILHEWQNKRTASECKAALSEGPFSLALFQYPRGPLHSSEVKKLFVFFSVLALDIQPVWSAAKKHWKRPRPYVTDETLHPCPGMHEKSYAYPSGHTAAGFIYGKVLADLFPNRAEQLIARGIEIGDHRVLGGVHHPTDVRDGRVLARRMLELLYRNSKFRSDLNHMRRVVD